MSNRFDTDEMVEVPIANIASNESLMVVDSVSSKEHYTLIFVIIFVMTLSFVAGIKGPQTTLRKVSTHDASSKIVTTTMGLSPIYGYYDLFLIFEKKQEIKTTQPVQIEAKIKLSSKKTGKDDTFTQILSVLPDFPRKSQISEPERIYHNEIIDFDTIKSEIICKTNWISHVSIITESLTSTCSFLIIVFRIACFIFAGVQLGLFIYLPEYKSYKMEQILSVILLILVMVYDNPLCIIELYIPSTFIQNVSRFSNCLFQSYFRVFILYLLAMVKDIHQQPSLILFFPTLFIQILIFIGNYINNDILDGIIGGIITIYFVFLLISSYSNCDPTDVHRYFIYVVMYFIVSGFIMVTRLLTIRTKVLDHTLTHFMVTIIGLNIYCCGMAFFHWPYQTSSDQEYIISEEQDGIEQLDLEIDDAR